jgi:Carboxypeptidase regulatory-like domain/TonB-dependent Receptor Plug Domain
MSLSRFSIFILLIAAMAMPLAAQTTGSISGHVTDSSGGALPGVTVEARSAAMQGTRATVTEADGGYRFPLLPPGSYALSYKLEGFAAQTRNAITVSLDKETAVDVALKPSAAQEITVTAAAPVLDTSSTTLGTNLDQRAIQELPSTGRNYASIVQVAPGVTSDANENNGSNPTISVYGSSGAENSFYVDGVNTTGVEYGFQGKELNFEFVQEVNVKTGGYEAEYGRSTGGIINVITKSGGNAFTGDVFGYSDRDSLQASTRRIFSTKGITTGYNRGDYGADLGGYIIKDKLWFFGAYDRTHNTSDIALPEGSIHAGEIVSSGVRNNLGSGKLTWNVAPSQSLVASFMQDPTATTGAIADSSHGLNGDPSTYLGRLDTGGRDYALRYDGSFASQWIVTAQAARHRERNSVGPATDAGQGIQYRDAANDFFQTGGFGLIQHKKFDRKFAGGSVDRYLGHHELKGGLEYQNETADVTKMMSGGQQVDVFANDADPSKPIYRHFYWTTPTATVSNAPVSQLVATPKHKGTSAYLQDRWSINDVTINAGLRWDRQQIIDASGVTQIDLKHDYAPRLGFIWDPSGTHAAKIFGSAGRYYEEIPMDLVIRSFSYERQPRIVNYSPTSTVPDPNAEADFGTSSTILGGFTEPADPHLKNQYLTEYILGGEREVMPNLALGIKGIYRSYGRVIEDFLCADDGTYCIGNPGEGLMKRIFTLDYSTTYPAPKPKRTYKGVQLDATKRFSDNWQAIASYVYSKLDGNYDGEYAPFTNLGADPNISAAYDYYDFFTNGSDLSKITNHGPLSNDRRHQFKLSGVYNSPWKLNVGVTAYWRSGTPLTRYGYSDAYSRYEFFLTPRGAEGRTPDNYDADVHLGYPIDAGRVRLNILLDIFNILNTQRPVLLDERWGFQESDNASPTPVNPNYLKPILRTPPTSARLGLRLSF